MADAAQWNATRAGAIIAAHTTMPGPLLPILHAIQAEFGCVPAEATSLIAQALNLSQADVHGVVTFYHDFRRAPAGQRVLKLCRAEACQAMGGTALSANLLVRLGVDWGETTADGTLTVEPVYCLGLCACAPAALLDGEPLGRLNDAALRDVLVA
jgi:formate dehydrogenase subunit gamma